MVPDMDFCKNNPESLLATIELTPSIDQIFKQVPNATHKFHTYSIAEARQSVLSTVCLELVELLNIKRMSPESLVDLTGPIAKYYLSISPATSAALSSYLPTRTHFFLWFLSRCLYSPSVLASPFLVDNGHVCLSIHSASSVEHLVVFFSLWKTLSPLLLIPSFCTCL